MFSFFRLWLLASGFWLLTTCSNSRLDVDVSHIQVPPVEIQRFDRDFFSLNADNIPEKLPELKQKYSDFAELFVRNILCRTGTDDSTCIPEIIRFVNDKDMREGYENCQKTFPNLNEFEEELQNVFQHYRYYFPKGTLPNVYAIFSGFNYSIVTSAPDPIGTGGIIAISLEMYLGKRNKFYMLLQIPEYKQFRMQKEYLASDFVRAWMLKRFPNTIKNKTLLSEMLYEGKLLYLADALLPGTNDTVKIGFTKKQLNWCMEYEKDMWGFLIKNNFLYSSQLDVISKFTGEGPFTAGFAKESPARTGVWLGWQIVKKYMNEHSEITLEQLMQEQDAQKILSLSKYKP